MKKYVLNEDSTISNKLGGETIIPKGTEILSNGYIDEDGGIKGKITKGEYEGMEIVFNISELNEIS
jgi:hypothetical protein